MCETNGWMVSRIMRLELRVVDIFRFSAFHTEHSSDKDDVEF